MQTNRNQIEADIIQQMSNEVQDTLLQHAPAKWSHEQCEALEENVLDHTRLVLSALTTTELQSASAFRKHIDQAVAETKRLVHLGGVRRLS